jgi:hypothetical protein
MKILEIVKDWEERNKMIEEAKKLLIKNGYLVIKPTAGQLKDNERCNKLSENGEDMDCSECRCNCCLMQQ